MIDVTGGGLRNFLRLRKGISISIDKPMPVPPIFQVLMELGSVEMTEAYQTFNMGLGFALVMPEAEAKKAVKVYGEGAKVVGHVDSGKGVIVPSLELEYQKY
jgi:phosphoribosylformylglycinamidine cyclo-ligase